MRSRFLSAFLFLLMTGAAIAQRRPDMFSNQRTPFEPEPSVELGIRLAILLVPFIIGLLIGLFFSPNAPSASLPTSELRGEVIVVSFPVP